MRNFFEGLKDILYDGIDYIMMILVIVVVALVINWRLGGLFAKDATDTISKKPSSTIENGNTTSNGKEEENKKKDSGRVDETAVDDKEDDGTSEKDVKDVIEITIPPGSLPAKIGDILVSKGLVSDGSEFVQKAVELNMETKLKSGEYYIEKNSSLEDIINILTK
ncbi:conserved hypothetical protein [[Clostridium] ultunense Esp]|uniref:Aminodeoxychorismate lyase n=1 Tax=[Clostridium] ultunense Esp TaxID=1288971 RepID=M1Z6Z4_9FIRM|nr:endolytic transglycosylase MltG [Schnuerera ultunensis]CCQ98595.1 conserved hypothetical protein [[Clostridium] ultunense Esp]SHD77786.1 conserved protein of unknown function [[Clostridium] ultunense Esp]